MSLYGTGRGEGIGATFLIAAIVLVVQLVGAWARPQATDLELLARICVPALGGAPGVQSARYAGEPRSDATNNAKLVRDIASHSDKSAYYYCVLVMVRHADDPQPIIADGVWHGQLIEQPRGQGGFGYDPYFFLPSLGKTAAELSAQEKNNLSHRGQALRALINKLS